MFTINIFEFVPEKGQINFVFHYIPGQRNAKLHE